MKKYIILLFAMLMASPAFCQKKEKEEPKTVKTDSLTTVTDTISVKTDSVTKVTTTTTVKTDSVAKAPATTTVVAATTTAKKDSVVKTSAHSAELDSLTKVTNLLTAKFNTVNAELEKYRAVYTVIKEKVLKRDFDPEKFAQIVDSLAAHRDSTSIGFAAVSVALRDSLIASRKEIAELKTKLDAASTEETAKAKLVNELKLLKDLLDSKIITQTEFDAKKALVLQKWK